MTPRRTFTILVRSGGPPWPVEVEYAAGGESLPVMVAGALELDLEALTAEASPRSYGVRLGEGLFRGGLRDAFVRAVRADDPLHVALSLEAEELRGLAWERLCGPLDGKFVPLGTDQRVAFSRLIRSSSDRAFPVLKAEELRVLAVIADPAGLDAYGLERVDTAAALAALGRGLGDVPFDVLGATEGALGPATLDALCAVLTEDRHTLLHLVAHGRQRKDGTGVLFLADAAGKVDTVTQVDLIDRLRGITQGLPHLAFFAACQSAAETTEAGVRGLARAMVADLGLPAMVAMQRDVSVGTAHAFTAAFYRRLRVHGYVDQAAVEAVAGLAGRGDALVPAVYTRIKGRPLFGAGATAVAVDPAVLTRAMSSAMHEIGRVSASVIQLPGAETTKQLYGAGKKLIKWGILIVVGILLLVVIAFQIYLYVRGRGG